MMADPDPTVLTIEAIDRRERALHEYVDGQVGIIQERLRGIDTATNVLNETVNRVPTDMQKEVSHVREITEEKFDSVSIQFKERDTRQEREARDNKVAVDAAFAAQKEAARTRRTPKPSTRASSRRPRRSTNSPSYSRPPPTRCAETSTTSSSPSATSRPDA